LVVSNSKFWPWQELLLSRDQKIFDEDFPFVFGCSRRTHARFRRNTWGVYSLLALQELTTVRAGVLLSFYGEFLTVSSLVARIRPSTDLAFPLQAFTGECVILRLPCAVEFSGDQLNCIPEGGFCSAASSNCCGRCYLFNIFQGIVWNTRCSLLLPGWVFQFRYCVKISFHICQVHFERQNVRSPARPVPWSSLAISWPALRVKALIRQWKKIAAVAYCFILDLMPVAGVCLDRWRSH
jgi:hypothetical protein